MSRVLVLFCALLLAATTVTAGDQQINCNFPGMKVEIDANQLTHYLLVGSCTISTPTSVANQPVKVKATWDQKSGVVTEEIGPHEWTVTGQGKCTGDPFSSGAGVSCQNLTLSSPKFPSEHFAPLIPLGSQLLNGAQRAQLAALKAIALTKPPKDAPPPPDLIPAAPPIIVAPAPGSSYHGEQSFRLVVNSGNALKVTKFAYQIERLKENGKWVQVFVQPFNSLNPTLDLAEQALGAIIPMKQFAPSTKIRVRARNSGGNHPWSAWREINITTLFNPAFALGPTIVMPMPNQVVSGPFTVKVNAGEGDPNVELAFDIYNPPGKFPGGWLPPPTLSKIYAAADADGYTFQAGTLKPGTFRVRARRPGKMWGPWSPFEVK